MNHEMRGALCNDACKAFLSKVKKLHGDRKLNTRTMSQAQDGLSEALGMTPVGRKLRAIQHIAKKVGAQPAPKAAKILLDFMAGKVTAPEALSQLTVKARRKLRRL